MFNALRAWRGNKLRRQITIGGREPVPEGIWGAHDAAMSHGLAGRSGTIRVGDTGDPARRYNGYLAYQRLAKIPPGAATTLRRGPSDALPSTHGDVREVLGGEVQQLLDEIGGRGRRR